MVGDRKSLRKSYEETGSLRENYLEIKKSVLLDREMWTFFIVL